MFKLKSVGEDMQDHDYLCCSKTPSQVKFLPSEHDYTLLI